MLFKLISLAISLEGMSILLAAKNLVGFWATIAVYSVHAAGSVLIALAVWISLPASMRQPKKWVLLLLFSSNFFVPLLPVLMRISIYFGYKYRKLHEEAPVAIIMEPEYSIYRASSSMQARSGRIRTKLMSLTVPVPERLTALLAIQETPARVSADLLRQLLADPVEDIRLLAYGMIDGKEKEIGSRILKEEEKLEKATAHDVIYGCNKRLAELYWELVYQKLVQGDMMAHSCEQARKHAEQAIEHEPEDAGIWFLLARVAIELRQADSAQKALEEAAYLGFPPDQLIPYRAELAFLQRDFEQVPLIFRQLRSQPGAMRLAAIYKFWTQ